MLKGLHELSITSYSCSSCANPTIKKKKLWCQTFSHFFLLLLFFPSSPSYHFLLLFISFFLCLFLSYVLFLFFCSFVLSFCIPSDFSILSHVILFYFYFLSPSLFLFFVCLPIFVFTLFVSVHLCVYPSLLRLACHECSENRYTKSN